MPTPALVGDYGPVSFGSRYSGSDSWGDTAELGFYWFLSGWYPMVYNNTYVIDDENASVQALEPSSDGISGLTCGYRSLDIPTVW